MENETTVLARVKPGCICKGIKLFALMQAIENGARSFEEVAEKTGIGDGSCKGKRCRQKVEEILGSRDEVE
ncbi:(2Fe-2S)-binding protein [Desulfogranum japonicum]|uniref:(2Fe-2S)-binding protein n=1 Tax=Desulfogranum japonicum TaxID=231447 RepID=UPI0004078C27|nr:(2Fe-2S)-binding protein [Desulfogranum japonicum]